MPPALSDEENGVSSGEEEIPYRSKGKGKAAASVDQEEEEEEDEEGEGAEDEYVVEKILTHKTQKGTVVYEVKWAGYDDPADYTWEPEENLEGAIDVLKEYWEDIGGKPEPGQKGKKRSRKSGAAESSTPASTKRAKKEKEWSPPPGSWESEVDYVDTVEESIDHKTGLLTRYAYLIWNNQKKSQHPLHHVYQKCPQKMLQYYESHLVFTQPGTDDMNGDIKGQ